MLRDARHVEEGSDLVWASATVEDRLALWCGRMPSPAPDMLRALSAQGDKFTEPLESSMILGKQGRRWHWNSGIVLLRNHGLIEVDGRTMHAAVLLRAS